MDQIWAMCEVQLTFDEVDSIFLSLFWKIIKDDRSRVNILDQGQQNIWSKLWIVLRLLMAI